jgi:hypothetical protein
MDFRRSKSCKWRCIIRSAIYPSRNPPTNSFEEAGKIVFAAGRTCQGKVYGVSLTPLLYGVSLTPLLDPVAAVAAVTDPVIRNLKNPF